MVSASTVDPFFLNLQRFGIRTAVISPDERRVSYSELAGLVDQFKAEHLSGQGLVFLLAENYLSCLIAYLACLQAARPVMLLDASINTPALSELYRLYGPSLTLEAGERADFCKVIKHESIDPGPVGELFIHPDLALMLSTSGSTGSPKQVMLTQRNLQANAFSIASYLQISACDRAITNLPFYYSYGLSVINSHLLCGATLLLNNDSVVTKPFWRFFDEFEPTSMTGVPHTYELLERLRFLRKPLRHLRYMTQAGGKLNADLVRKYAEGLHKKEILFFVMYGQTEATARMSYLDPTEVFIAPSSIGRPIPGGRFIIVDEAGKEVRQSGVKGGLIYYGDNVMMGYAESAGDLCKGGGDGRLVTGDVAYFDDDGRFYLCGRKDRIIKVFGHRIDLEDLQKRLSVFTPSVICTGEENRIVVGVVKDNSMTKEQMVTELKSQIFDILAVHHSAIKVLVLDEVPRTANGKISYNLLLQAGVLMLTFRS